MLSDNVVLFPKWKKVLEGESLEALKAKRYDEALDKLNELIHYHVDHQEIMVGKMICLMELGQHDEAESFAQSLLDRRDDGYYHYMHIYLTILFQTNQYARLMELVRDEINERDIPFMMKEQFEQLYALSENMQLNILEEQSKEQIAGLMEAFKAGNASLQWHLIQSLHVAGVQPRTDMLKYLIDETVHPVTKTALLLWFKDSQLELSYEVHKFDQEITFSKADIPKLENRPLQKEVLFMIRNLEQQNPSIYDMITNILRQYLYVRYPFDVPRTDSFLVAEALQKIAEKNFTGTEVDIEDSRVQQYIDEIQTCQAFYLALIGE